MFHKTTILTISVVVSFVVFSFLSASERYDSTRSVKESFLDGFDELIERVDDLVLEIGQGDSLSVSLSYHRVRSSFKEIEFLLAELDRQYYSKFLNGAPLPKLEKKVPDLAVIEPKGLQVIDELVCDVKARNKLGSQVDIFKKNLLTYRNFLSAVDIKYEVLSRAIKFEMIRLYTMSITGFDTPGTLLGLDDAVSTLHGFQKHLLEHMNLAEKAATLVDQNLRYINENNSFDEFDRAAYYKQYWQPLYAMLLEELEVDAEQQIPALHQFPKEVNLESDQLFNLSFLNKVAFLDFYEGEYNENTIELGRDLFFDPSLSGNASMSCATCHSPELAFSDGRVKSIAITGDTTVDRNAPGLINSIYTKGFFYDLRAPLLKQQFEHVIFSEKEFNTSIMEILEKLRSSEKYVSTFKATFPQHVKQPVNIYTFKTALSAYVASLDDMDSEFDKFIRKEAEVEDEVVKGFNLFMGKAACATCHFPPLFSGLVPPYFDESESEVLGVPNDTSFAQIDPDLGRYDPKRPKELVDFYKHSFKTTSVRNVDRTAPYMHNGVFNTLEEVLDFYNEGGGAGRGLAVPNQTLAPDKLDLEDHELESIIAFLRSLNSN